MGGTSLPPGFRFHPTDVELVLYYLKRKVMGKRLHFEAIAEVNIYKFSPWDLPDKSCLKSKDLEWFFFCPREKKYASGLRVKRATENGYWKTTGKDRPICHNDQTVGSVKTLVFHLGHAPKGERTDWVIHEYKILDDKLAAAGVQDSYVLCKVFKKNGPGPRNGAQYGAPFNEADWADDDGIRNHAMSLEADGPPPTMLMQAETQSCPLLTGLFDPGSTSALPLIEGPSSSAGHPTSNVLMDEIDDEMVRLLATFTDDNMLLHSEDGFNQDDLSEKEKNKHLTGPDGYDIYSGLGDLDSWAQIDEGRLDLSAMQKYQYSLNSVLAQDDSAYIELDDFLAPLTCSDGVTVTEQSSLGETFGSYSQDQQFHTGASFDGVNQFSSRANQLPKTPEGFCEGDNCFDALQMADNQFYLGSDFAYDMDLLFELPDNVVNSDQDMERGTHEKKCYSTLMGTVPARSPSAAEQIALSYSTSGGSSIHIKAEVTHGAGECTNEALSVMMGGSSSSCWCNLAWVFFQEMWPLVGNCLLYLLLDFVGFDLVLVYCCLNETLFIAWSDNYLYSIANLVTIFFSTNFMLCGNPVSFLRNTTSGYMITGMHAFVTVFGFCGSHPTIFLIC